MLQLVRTGGGPPIDLSSACLAAVDEGHEAAAPPGKTDATQVGSSPSLARHMAGGSSLSLLPEEVVTPGRRRPSQSLAGGRRSIGGSLLDYCAGLDGRKSGTAPTPRPGSTSPPSTRTPDDNGSSSDTPRPVGTPSASVLLDASPAPPVVTEPLVARGRYQSLQSFCDAHPGARVFGRSTALAPPYRIRNRYASRSHFVIERFEPHFAMAVAVAVRDRLQRGLEGGVALLGTDDERQRVRTLFNDRVDSLQRLAVLPPRPFYLLTPTSGNPTFLNNIRLPVDLPVLLQPGDSLSVLEPPSAAAGYDSWQVRERSPSPPQLSGRTSRRRSRSAAVDK